MKILFSEDEWYYRELGLVDKEGCNFYFGGMRFYKKSTNFLSSYDAFVCAYYTLPHNALLTDRFKRIGVPTILCSDGIFDFSNAFLNIMHRKYGLIQFHPVIQDFFICVGVREAEYFSSEVEALDYMPKRMISMETPLGLPAKEKVLLTTANTAYFDDAEYSRLLRLMLDVIETLDKRSVSFSVRIYDERLLKELLAYSGQEFKNDVDHGFEETLKCYSSVITTPSSIAVTSMYHQRPTALLVYRDTPMFMQSGWMITSADLLNDSLDGFLKPSRDRLEVQNKLLLNYNVDNDLSGRILDLIKSSPDSVKYNDFVYKSYENMLISKFNFNIEWYVRKVYRHMKGSKKISFLMERIKKKIF